MTDRPSFDADRRRAQVRRAARWATVLMVATVALSAYMRLSLAAAPCQPWPLCQGGGSAGLDGVSLARGLHRVVATGVLALAVAMVLLTRPLGGSRERRLSLVLLALVGALAVLGLVTPGARVPAVTLGNLLGGFAVVVCCARLAQADVPPAALHAHAWAAAALVSVQVALGGQIGATFSAAACPAGTDCLWAAQAGWTWRAFDPWLPATSAGPGAAAAAALHVVHRLVAALCALVLAALALRAWRAGAKRSAGAIAALLVVQGLLAVLQVRHGLPTGLVLAHNLAALGLLVASASQLRLQRAAA